MTLLGFIILLVIAAIAGGIGQSISGYSFGGCFASIVIGFIGAYLGQWLSVQMELPLFWVIYIQGQSFPIIWAVIGGALFSFILGIITRSRKGD